MKKLFILLSVLILVLSGCNSKSDDEVSKIIFGSKLAKKESVSKTDKKQFIEILNSKNKLIGIIEDSNSIKELTKKLNIKSWKYCDHLKKNAKLKYIYKGYEVVEDPYYLEDKKPYIIKDGMELYESGSDFYIIDYSEDSRDIVKVEKSTGNYLNSPEKLNINKKKTAKEIIKKWKKEINGLQDREKEDIDYDDKHDNIVEGFEVLTEADVEKTSKEQRLEILDNNLDVLYRTTNITEITEFLNALCMKKWKEVKSISDSATVNCSIIRYAIKRKTPEDKLVKISQDILYKYKGDYYFKDIIPGNGNQERDYISYYKIPERAVEYIHSLSTN